MALIYIFPPLSALWIMGVGGRIQQLLGRNDSLFNILSCVNFVISFLPLVHIVYMFIYHRQMEIKEVKLIVGIAMSIWAVLAIFLSRMTVELNRTNDEDKHYTFIDNLDYVRQFFVYFCWAAFLWIIQRRVQTYLVKKN